MSAPRFLLVITDFIVGIKIFNREARKEIAKRAKKIRCFSSRSWRSSLRDLRG
jgi:hypothetical protein